MGPASPLEEWKIDGVTPMKRAPDFRHQERLVLPTLKCELYDDTAWFIETGEVDSLVHRFIVSQGGSLHLHDLTAEAGCRSEFTNSVSKFATLALRVHALQTSTELMAWVFFKQILVI